MKTHNNLDLRCQPGEVPLGNPRHLKAVGGGGEVELLCLLFLTFVPCDTWSFEYLDQSVWHQV